MATEYTTPLTTPTITTTGTRQRTVSDTIRNLFPGNDFLMLVETGLPNMKEVRQKRGLIKKRKVNNTRFEAFTYTPLAITCTVSTWTSITDFTVSSANGLTVKMCLLNTRNKTVCRISTISSTTLNCVSIGDTTFTAQADDTLLILGPAYGENSSSPYLLMKDEDNLYNCTQIFRFPVAISNTAGGNPHWGGSYWGRIKERGVVEGLRKVTHSLLFQDRASSGETTTDSTLSDSPRTLRGMWHWAGASYDAGGNMTFEKYQNNLALAMNDTVGQSTRKVMLHGTEVWADILGWINNGLAVVEPGDYKFWGVQTKKLLTARGMVNCVLVDAFDRGDLNKNALIFDPDDVEYVYKNKGPGDKQDRDLHPVLGIQNPDVDGVMDEIKGELSISVNDGGQNITTITNWL